MLQVQTAVLLNVKSLVFDAPARPPAARGEGANIGPFHPDIGHPGKGRGGAVGCALLAEQGVDLVPAACAVEVLQVVDPARKA